MHAIHILRVEPEKVRHRVHVGGHEIGDQQRGRLLDRLEQSCSLGLSDEVRSDPDLVDNEQVVLLRECHVDHFFCVVHLEEDVVANAAIHVQRELGDREAELFEEHPQDVEPKTERATFRCEEVDDAETGGLGEACLLGLLPFVSGRCCCGRGVVHRDPPVYGSA